MCSFATFISLLASVLFFLLKQCSYHDTNDSCLQEEEIEQQQRGVGSDGPRLWLVSLSKQRLKSTTYLWFIGRKYAKQGPVQRWLMGFVRYGDD